MSKITNYGLTGLAQGAL